MGVAGQGWATQVTLTVPAQSSWEIQGDPLLGTGHLPGCVDVWGWDVSHWWAQLCGTPGWEGQGYGELGGWSFCWGAGDGGGGVGSCWIFIPKYRDGTAGRRSSSFIVT